MINQPQYSLKSSLTQRSLTSFNSVKAERGEEAVGKNKSLILAEIGSMEFKERSHFNTKAQGEAASDKVRVAARYPEFLAKTLNESDYTQQQIFNIDKTDFC